MTGEVQKQGLEMDGMEDRRRTESRRKGSGKRKEGEEIRRERAKEPSAVSLIVEKLRGEKLLCGELSLSPCERL